MSGWSGIPPPEEDQPLSQKRGKHVVRRFSADNLTSPPETPKESNERLWPQFWGCEFFVFSPCSIVSKSETIL